jgi:hypothetical protein
MPILDDKKNTPMWAVTDHVPEALFDEQEQWRLHAINPAAANSRQSGKNKTPWWSLATAAEFEYQNGNVRAGLQL